MADGNRPKNLQDLLGEGSSQEKSLEEILRADAEDEELDQEKRHQAAAKSNRPKFIVAGIAAFVVGAGLLALTPAYDVFDGGNSSSTPKLEVAKLDESKSGVKGGPTTSEWYDTKAGVDDPVPTPSYTSKEAPRSAQEIDKSRITDAESSLKRTKLLRVAKTMMVSEREGATSDVTKRYNSDGTLNLDFRFITTDVFMKESQEILNRLINPAYGGWEGFQYQDGYAKRDFKANKLTEIMTPAYAEKVAKAKDKSFVPVLADWDHNDYGLIDTLLPNQRWYGTVSDADLRMKWNQANGNYDYTAAYTVDYVAWTQDKKKIARRGVLKLDLVVDRNAALNPDEFRIKLDGGSLVFKGADIPKATKKSSKK